MVNLSAFLKQNAIQSENIKYVASKRFLDESGDPIAWEIKAIDSETDERIRKACTKKVPMPGKSSVFIPELDLNKYAAKLAAECTVYPPLANKELQDSYGVMGEEALLKAMLLPGEYADYTQKVQEACGFNESMDDMVDEVKNS